MTTQQSVCYFYFNDCWKNGTITTSEMAAAVEMGLITEYERLEMVAKPRGDAFPDDG
ncbi:XkdX family protein [Bacillus changyiensis]|uniref:XkdX family protein n=1 Tax=Bacillus changyiensis TaxID=3004103 RepID=UPI0022E24ECD|nr:XkdX family protein [Bacillus changyiensis]MDA1478354.1 XkdX family protein [Bacillus changyiensis]